MRFVEDYLVLSESERLSMERGFQQAKKRNFLNREHYDGPISALQVDSGVTLSPKVTRERDLSAWNRAQAELWFKLMPVLDLDKNDVKKWMRFGAFFHAFWEENQRVPTLYEVCDALGYIRDGELAGLAEE